MATKRTKRTIIRSLRGSGLSLPQRAKFARIVLTEGLFAAICWARTVGSPRLHIEAGIVVGSDDDDVFYSVLSDGVEIYSS